MVLIILGHLRSGRLLHSTLLLNALFRDAHRLHLFQIALQFVYLHNNVPKLFKKLDWSIKSHHLFLFLVFSRQTLFNILFLFWKLLLIVNSEPFEAFSVREKTKPGHNSWKVIRIIGRCTFGLIFGQSVLLALFPVAAIYASIGPRINAKSAFFVI